MSRFQSEFYGEYSSDDILSQEHLTVVSVPCDVHKEYVKDTYFFKMNKFSKKEPVNFDM